MPVGQDIDNVQPWRKSFPLAKPPTPGSREDAQRFITEFENAADGVTLSDDWTLADVIKSEHEGASSCQVRLFWYSGLNDSPLDGALVSNCASSVCYTL